VAITNMLIEALRLSVEQRAKLALELLRSLAGEPDPDTQPSWDTELDRRRAEVDGGTADTMGLDEYRAHVRQRRIARVHQAFAE
jgi:putative addiction module component (TIGR02574 family)